ncbi:MAG TPA: hypothetical protein DCW74_03820, partial [Alteromonas australica]|nr:hypothetical protein [Alteromonas australica]
TGYLLPANAPAKEWAKILVHCVKNPKHVAEMGENLHKITEQYFDLNKVVKHRMELYQEAIGLVSSRDKDKAGKINFNTEWEFHE